MSNKEDLGLIWMSAGNSYFREEVIEELIRFAVEKFDRVIAMAPDEPAEHTYKAWGYEESKAKRKARLNANLLQNRAKRIKERLKKEGVNGNLKVVEWIDEVLPHREYQKKYSEILELYKTNKEFRKDAEETTKAVLESKFEHVPEEAVREAVHYLIKELAFVWASLAIYNAKSVSYIYHNRWLIYEKFINGKYDGIKKPGLRFLLHD